MFVRPELFGYVSEDINTQLPAQKSTPSPVVWLGQISAMTRDFEKYLASWKGVIPDHQSILLSSFQGKMVADYSVKDVFKAFVGPTTSQESYGIKRY